ncbi:hypothetical protein E7Z59_07555 [Robertkochia marina]|uniref:Lipocalin-like domain-containing protein n=1 Tax=Robertkochia marina TaxID=1227945 RepID=A0A4S3M1S4_9FLAO|nr:hypothetical protein [Robertkochia marina]THD67509.1 hypothetical protein E7Z59_07555 [Robertkochia marina]TRZ44624.1 hypothetical protein D3A96_08395 [Robertkochia marina]
MKLLSYAIVLVVVMVLFAAKPGNNEDIQLSLEGTWEQVDQYTYDGEKVVDTIEASEGYRQIKMFYDGKVMWSRFVPKDSVEWFAYGSYVITDSSLTETLEYGSASMMRVIDTFRVFSFKLILDEDTYSQIQLDADGNPLLQENYKRLQ